MVERSETTLYYMHFGQVSKFTSSTMRKSTKIWRKLCLTYIYISTMRKSTKIWRKFCLTFINSNTMRNSTKIWRKFCLTYIYSSTMRKSTKIWRKFISAYIRTCARVEWEHNTTHLSVSIVVLCPCSTTAFVPLSAFGGGRLYLDDVPKMRK